MVLSELSLLTMLQRALLCPSCGQTDDSGHVSDHKWHNTKCIRIYIILEVKNHQFFNYNNDDHYQSNPYPNVFLENSLVIPYCVIFTLEALL